jgi:GntR family transcriptional regulator, transcriptional repressor for pyruvate dehydrogenase complex
MPDLAKSGEARRLASLRTPPLKEQVIRELTRLIDEKLFAPGEQLPTERELSERLAVSRSTVREAMQFLQALGVLEIRHGSGTFVAEPERRPQELQREWRDWTRRHARRVHELLELRQGIESFAAELAATRVAASSEPLPALNEMNDALDQMALGAKDPGNVTLLVRADVNFHRALCGAAGNLAIDEFTELLAKQLVRERAAVWAIDGRPGRSLAEHREIYDAVRAGHREAARIAMLNHLRSVELDIDRSLLGGEAPETTERGE